jgi:DNA-directed RNA polymerase specialized sigma24 family protein
MNQTLQEWAEQTLQVCVRLTYHRCRNLGCPHARALDLAEQAVQHALDRAVSISRSAREFENCRHFHLWLLTTAMNHVRNVLRQETSHLHSQGGEAIVDCTADPQEAVRALLDQLPDEDRRLILIRRRGDVTLGQLGEFLSLRQGRSKNPRHLTLLQQLHDIHSRLRQQGIDQELEAIAVTSDEDEGQESIQRLYQSLGLTCTDPFVPPPINWDEFKLLLLGIPKVNHGTS